MIDTIEPDECCSKWWSDACANGELATTDFWHCPECSTEWRPQIINGVIRHWSPVPLLAILKA